MKPPPLDLTRFGFRLVSFWSDKPLLDKSAALAQLQILEIRARGPVNLNKRSTKDHIQLRRLTTEEQQRFLDLKTFNGNPQ